MKKLFFILLSLLAILFLVEVFSTIDAVVGLAFLLVLVLDLVVLILAFASKPCRKYKWWAIGLVLFQVMVLFGLNRRSHRYYQSFVAKKDKAVLFEMADNTYGSSVTTKTITTVYVDGSAYVLTREVSDNSAMWEFDRCDSVTVRWTVTTDSLSRNEGDVLFDLKNRTFETSPVWGVRSLGNIDWDRLEQLGCQQSPESQYLNFSVEQ